MPIYFVWFVYDIIYLAVCMIVRDGCTCSIGLFIYLRVGLWINKQRFQRVDYFVEIFGSASCVIAGVECGFWVDCT